MRRYQVSPVCRLRFLREQLDDPEASDCGRCDNCAAQKHSGQLNPEGAVVPTETAKAAAVQFLRDVTVPIEPRKQWPRGLDARRGNIPPGSRPQIGRALAFGTDPGWSEVVAPLFSAADAPPSAELLAGLAAVLKAWPWQHRPTWITWVPSRSRPVLVEGLARGLGELGKLTVLDAVQRLRVDAPPQDNMQNSSTQAANVIEAFSFGQPNGQQFPAGPCLVLDDSLRSGWTMTLVAEGLLAAGASEVLPVVLWRRP